MVRTVFIWNDLPKYVEYNAGLLYPMNVGGVIDFDLIVSVPGIKPRQYSISGQYEIVKIYNRFGGKHQGLTQYLEFVKKEN